jgi:HEAT repeat protein
MPLVGGLEQREEDIVGDFAAAALAGLAVQGEASDAQRARRYLQMPREDVRIEAIRVITRFGGEEDLDALIAIAKTGSGTLKAQAANAALQIDAHGERVVREFLGTRDPGLVNYSLTALLARGDTANSAEMVMPLLDDMNLEVQTAAISFLVSRFSRAELEVLLETYLQKPRHFYRVVAILDQVLYAPGTLRGVLTQRIETRLGDG